LELILEACHIEITVDDEGHDKTRSTTREGKKGKVERKLEKTSIEFQQLKCRKKKQGKQEGQKQCSSWRRSLIKRLIEKKKKKTANDETLQETQAQTEGENTARERRRERRERERECVCVCVGGGVNSQIGTPTKLFVSCAITHPPIYIF
jgi:hypothetical protein